MIGSKVDVVGSGLAGRLTARALKTRWPELDVKIVRRIDAAKSADLKSKNPGLGPTWCFHDADVSSESWVWLRRSVSKSWSHYDVEFPTHQRRLESRYHAIKSEDFFAATDLEFANDFIESERPSSNLTILATGWPALAKTSEVAWQKFLGLDVTLAAPHGLQGPILKDATVPQTDGYRFFYSLPWSETSLLIEDTYYSTTSNLDAVAVRKEVLNYAEQRGWKVKSVDREEQGALPLALTSKDFELPQDDSRLRPVIRMGAASGLAHPVTGYTTSILFRQIEALVSQGAIQTTTETTTETSAAPNFDPVQVVANVAAENEKLRRSFSYFHLLNRMLFHAASAEKRYRVLERFYKLDPGLISRFYSARLGLKDQARILMGRPPVPLFKALREFQQWQTQRS